MSDLLRVFWENHDPTQGMRQGNDVGTQYRSAIYTTSDAQRRAAEASRDRYQADLTGTGYGPITTEIRDAPPFYYAEEYHQQYLAQEPRRLLRHRGDRREVLSYLVAHGAPPPAAPATARYTRLRAVFFS